MKIRWSTFASGQGTNLQNVLDLESQWKHQSVVSVHVDRRCYAEERAIRAGKFVFHLSSKDHQYSEKLLQHLQEVDANALILLGYMKILPPQFLSKWKKPIVNLHPSALPKYPGLNAIEKAFHAKESSLGVSLHYVVEEVDAGAIIRQLSFPREEDWSLFVCEEKVHEKERFLVQQFLFDLDAQEAERVAFLRDGSDHF